MLLKVFHLGLISCWLFVFSDALTFPFFINLYDDEVAIKEETLPKKRELNSFHIESTSDSMPSDSNSAVYPSEIDSLKDTSTFVEDEASIFISGSSELNQQANQPKILPRSSSELLSDISDKTMQVSNPTLKNPTEEVSNLNTNTIKQFNVMEFDGKNSAVEKENLETISSKTPDKDLLADPIEEGVNFTSLCFRLVVAMMDNLMETLIAIGQPILNSRSNKTLLQINQNPSRKIMKRDLSPKQAESGDEIASSDKEVTNHDEFKILTEKYENTKNEFEQTTQNDNKLASSEKGPLLVDLGLGLLVNDQIKNQDFTTSTKKSKEINLDTKPGVLKSIIERGISISKEITTMSDSVKKDETTKKSIGLEEMKNVDVKKIETIQPSTVISQVQTDKQVIMKIMPKNIQEKSITEDKNYLPNFFFGEMGKQLNQQGDISQTQPIDSPQFQDGGEYPYEGSMSNGTLLLIIGTVTTITLVMALAVMAAVYKLRLINFNILQRENRTPSGPRTSFA